MPKSRLRPALACLLLLRKVIQPLKLRSHEMKALMESLTDLDRLYGGMERLQSTPLSPTYMRHSSRGLILWLFMLPCGLLGAGCTTALKHLLVVVSTSYVMLGIDEIGVDLEEPFGVLPLEALAGALTRDVAVALAE